MKLYEFFGNIKHDNKEDKEDPANQQRAEKEQEMADDLFWFILDNDRLHKEFFLPLAKDIAKKHKEKSNEDTHDYKLWMPMVSAACVQYFKKRDVEGNPAEVFNKKFRSELCQRLADHHHKDIIDNAYKLGH